MKFKEHLNEIHHQEKLQHWQKDQQPEYSPEKQEDNSPDQEDENREMSNWAADDFRGHNYFSNTHDNRNFRGSWHGDRFPQRHPRNFFPHPQYHHRERFNRARVRSDENPEHVRQHPPWVGGGGNIIPQEFRGGPPFNGGMVNNYYLNQANNQCLWRRNSSDGQHGGKANNSHDPYPVGGRRPSYDVEAGVSLRREPQPPFHPSGRNSWHDSNASEVKHTKDETEETAVKLNMQPASTSNTKSEETAPSTQAKIECKSKEESCVEIKSKTSDHGRTKSELINSKHEQKETALGTQTEIQNGSKEGSYVGKMAKASDFGRTTTELSTSKREQKESTPIIKTQAENGSKEEGYSVYGTQESSDSTLCSDSPTGKNTRKGKPRKLARLAEEEKKEGGGDMSSGADLTLSKDTRSQSVTQDRISSPVEYEKGGTVRNRETSTKWLDKTLNNEKDVATTGLKGDSSTVVSGDFSFAVKRESLSNQESNNQTKGNKEPLLCSKEQLTEKRKGCQEDYAFLADQESLVSKGNSLTCLEKRNEPFNSSKKTVNSSQTTSKEQTLGRISVSSLKTKSVSNSKEQTESSVKTSLLPTCGSFGTKNKGKFPHVSKNTDAKGKTFERNVSGEIKPKANDHSIYPTTSSNVRELTWGKREGKLKSLLGMENQPKDSEVCKF